MPDVTVTILDLPVHGDRVGIRCIGNLPMDVAEAKPGCVSVIPIESRR